MKTIFYKIPEVNVFTKEIEWKERYLMINQKAKQMKEENKILIFCGIICLILGVIDGI